MIDEFLSNSKYSPVSFLFKDAGDSVFHIKGSGLAALGFDSIDEEAHTWANDVSDYPVEGKKDVSDNIKQRPDELRITAFISDTPISAIVKTMMQTADRFLNGRSRTAAAFEQIKALRDLRIPVTVTTRYRVYENMAITEATIRRTPDIGSALVVDLSFKEIRIVSTQMGRVPDGIGRSGAQAGNTAKTRAGVKTDAGKSTGRKVSPDLKGAVKQGSKANALVRQQSIIDALADELQKHGISREATAAVIGGLAAGVPGATAAVGTVNP
ncbi:phage baseplate protein [Leclercia sp.]|uniref:phage baseplate protein n=1 Tax=Leclercia sp. TaxID=1898428 RepID=UPI0028B06912|nr:hypothetical protein [Leclercia sp.]